MVSHSWPFFALVISWLLLLGCVSCRPLEDAHTQSGMSSGAVSLLQVGVGARLSRDAQNKNAHLSKIHHQMPLFNEEASKVSATLDADNKSSANKLHGDWVYFLHIPKTGGSSFNNDARHILRLAGSGLQYEEGCYAWAQMKIHADSVITMLRSPRAHVLSMHSHCATAPERTIFKTKSSFEEWVHSWVKLKASGTVHGDFAPYVRDTDFVHSYLTLLPFKCYNPIDMQCQRMTCEKPFRYPEHTDVQKAIDNMAKSKFVGILELYHESMCLLHAKTIGLLPSNCLCGQQNTDGEHHNTHGVKQHSVDDISEAVLEEVDQLTSGDRVLYSAALERFMQEVAEVERRLDVKFVCEDKASLTQRLLHLKGPPLMKYAELGKQWQGELIR